jgi:hypothetical protein
MSSERKFVAKEYLEISSSDLASASVVADNIQRTMTIVQTTFANEGQQQASPSAICVWPFSSAGAALPTV